MRLFCRLEPRCKSTAAKAAVCSDGGKHALVCSDDQVLFYHRCVKLAPWRSRLSVGAFVVWRPRRRERSAAPPGAFTLQGPQSKPFCLFRPRLAPPLRASSTTDQSRREFQRGADVPSLSLSWRNTWPSASCGCPFKAEHPQDLAVFMTGTLLAGLTLLKQGAI